VTENSVKREGLSDTDAKKNSSGSPFELASSEKELPERRSVAKVPLLLTLLLFICLFIWHKVYHGGECLLMVYLTTLSAYQSIQALASSYRMINE
jgi:hypothetical protein